MRSYFFRLGAALLGVCLFVAIAIVLEAKVGIPFKTTFRIACATACLVFIAKIGSDYPGQRWHKVAFFAALTVNVGLLFSPLANAPASKGDMLLFGLPDATIVLAARTMSYPVIDDHTRAVRQQLFVGLLLATVFCAMFLSIYLIPAPTGR